MRDPLDQRFEGLLLRRVVQSVHVAVDVVKLYVLVKVGFQLFYGRHFTHGLADARNRQVPEDVISDRIEPDPVIDVPEDDLWCILQRPLNHGHRSVYLLHGLR